VVLLQLKCL